MKVTFKHWLTGKVETVEGEEIAKITPSFEFLGDGKDDKGNNYKVLLKNKKYYFVFFDEDWWISKYL